MADVIAVLLMVGILVDDTRRERQQRFDRQAIRSSAPADNAGYRSWFDIESLANSGGPGAVLALVLLPILWVGGAVRRRRQHRQD